MPDNTAIDTKKAPKTARISSFWENFFLNHYWYLLSDATFEPNVLIWLAENLQNGKDVMGVFGGNIYLIEIETKNIERL